jgi:DNA-binding response OmpR family regulator
MLATVRVLIVEDQRMLADAIAEGLRREAQAVDVAYDGAMASERLSVNEYDVIVLDRDLPVVHGDEICRFVAESGSPTRVLMLTASAAVSDRVAGLNLGADDYLPKPFDFTELVARIRALARRASPPRPPVLSRAGVWLDPHKHEVRRDGTEIRLSRKEFAVLEELLRADGDIVSSERLLEKAWDEHVNPFTNVIRVIMVSLRRKLGDPPVVQTVYGVGYRIP